MDYLTYADRLNYLKELLQKDCVASPKDLARRWQCSECTVRRMINRLRERGLTIKYNRSCKKYFLEKK